MKDEDLISAFLQGDQGAFELLVSRYQRSLYYTVKAMVLDTEDARDITQQAFIKAFNNLRGLNNRSNFRGWLFRIACNLALDVLKSRRKEVDLESQVLIGPGNGPEQEMMARDLGKIMRGAISKLPPRQQQVVTLRALKGLGFDEISRNLGISPQTVRANFHFGLKTLKRILKQQGIANEL